MTYRMVQSGRVFSLVVCAAALLSGCESKGPAERTGEKIDQGVQNVKDAVVPAGPGEKAGRAVDRAVNP